MGKFYFKKISLGTCPHIREEVATLELLEEYGNIINNFPIWVLGKYRRYGRNIFAGQRKKITTVKYILGRKIND